MHHVACVLNVYWMIKKAMMMKMTKMISMVVVVVVMMR